MIFTIAGISKRYIDNIVLENVSAEIAGGKIYGLIGYNGGGKSTLAKIICGVIESDEGKLFLDGKDCTNWTIKEAMREGVFLVDHYSTMISDLSVEENILLGINFIKRNPLFGTFASRIEFKKKYKKLFKHYGINCDVNLLVAKLPRAMQNIIELIRVQICSPRLVVIDEIDTNIDRKSQKIIDRIIADMALAGIAVIYISHNLDHVLNIADVVEIIVETQLVDTMETSSVDAESIIDTLVRISKEKPPRIIIEPQAVILEMKHIHNNMIEDFSLEVREGEIVGIIGLDREGEASFSKLLFSDKGKKLFRENEVRITTPQEAADKGVIFLDSNIMQNYIFPDSSITENMIPYRLRTKHLSDELKEGLCKRYLNKLSIYAEPGDKIEQLSTGHQKKVLIVKNILSEGEVYIFDRLTDNIDVVSKVDIFNIINELKRKGKGIILISNDYNEIVGISDVVYIVKGGKTSPKMYNNKRNEKEILDRCLDISERIKEDEQKR